MLSLSHSGLCCSSDKISLNWADSFICSARVFMASLNSPMYTRYMLKNSACMKEEEEEEVWSYWNTVVLSGIGKNEAELCCWCLYAADSAVLLQTFSDLYRSKFLTFGSICKY